MPTIHLSSLYRHWWEIILPAEDPSCTPLSYMVVICIHSFSWSQYRYKRDHTLLHSEHYQSDEHVKQHKISSKVHTKYLTNVYSKVEKKKTIKNCVISFRDQWILLVFSVWFVMEFILEVHTDSPKDQKAHSLALSNQKIEPFIRSILFSIRHFKENRVRKFHLYDNLYDNQVQLARCFSQCICSLR